MAWMQLEDILLGEISRYLYKTQIFCNFMYRKYLEETNSQRQKVDGGCQGLEKEEGELMFTGDRGSVWEDEKLWGMEVGDGCTTM